MTTNGIVQKIWNFCHTLRDDGVGYGDYLEQITYQLFLKNCDDSVQTHPMTPSYIVAMTQARPDSSHR